MLRNDSANVQRHVHSDAPQRDKQIAELEKQLRRSQARADRAERLVELQKKVSELLGIPLPDPENETKR